MDPKNLDKIRFAYAAIDAILEDFDLTEFTNEAFVLFFDARIKLRYLMRQEQVDPRISTS